MTTPAPAAAPIVSLSEADLTPEVISMGTCRMLRIRRIGAVFFVENLFQERAADGTVTDQWKSVAVAKGANARIEALQWLQTANEEAIRLSVAAR